MQLIEDRICPVCGHANAWEFGLARHWVNGVKFVHIKVRNRFTVSKIHIMVSILRDGIRYLPQ